MSSELRRYVRVFGGMVPFRHLLKSSLYQLRKGFSQDLEIFSVGLVCTSALRFNLQGCGL